MEKYPCTSIPRHRREIEVVREIGFVFDSAMSLDELLTVIVQKTTRLMKASRSTLFISDGETGLVSRVMEGNLVNEIRLTEGQGLAGWTAHHRRPLLVEDAYQDERFDPSWDQDSGFHTGSVICHPVLDQQGEVVGVLEALNKQVGTFDVPDLELMSLISEQVALTLQNFRLMNRLVQKNLALAHARQNLHKKNEEIELLLDLERCVAASTDSADLFNNILVRTLNATEAQSCLIYRIDEMGAEIRVIGIGETQARIERTPVGMGLPGWVAAKGETVCMEVPALDSRFSETVEFIVGFSIQSVAAVPLKPSNDGIQKGALVVYNKRGSRGFLQEDVQLLVAVSTRLVHAINSFIAREQQERDRRLATIGRLLAGVLHDLKSPMTVISGYTQLLEAEMAGKEELLYVQGVSRAVARMSAMAQEIIAFSKGERDLLISNHDIGQLVERFEQELSPIFKTNQVGFSKMVRTSGRIAVDGEKLLRVFQNVAINAVEAMGNGGALALEVYRDDENVVFSISDNGPGIPDEIRASLFQSFVTYGKSEGTGLGLAVAKEIIDAHNGKLDFTTSKQGTTFFVRLPMRDGG